MSEISHLFMGDARKGKIDVVILDTKELLDPTIKDKDLWMRRLPYSPYYSQINSVSNKTKVAVAYRKKLTILDFWQDRDYDEVPDQSEYTAEEVEVGHHIMFHNFDEDEDEEDDDDDDYESDNNNIADSDSDIQSDNNDS